jgi:hypothetical protein
MAKMQFLWGNSTEVRETLFLRTKIPSPLLFTPLFSCEEVAANDRR